MEELKRKLEENEADAGREKRALKHRAAVAEGMWVRSCACGEGKFNKEMKLGFCYFPDFSKHSKFVKP